MASLEEEAVPIEAGATADYESPVIISNDNPSGAVSQSVSAADEESEAKENARFSLREPPRPSKIAVQSTRTSEGQTPFTLYVILVEWDGEAWTVSRRFSEFEALHNALFQRVSKLPPMPSKTWWRTLDPDFVNKRKEQLHDMIQEMLTITAVLHSKEFRSFFEVSKHLKQALPQHMYPKLLSEVKDENFGVTDYVMDLKAPVLLTTAEETHLLNRLDAQISNVRFPWEEKGIIAPVGAFNVWLQKGSSTQWEVVHNEYYDVSATSLAWDALRSYAFVGLANGRIITYMLNMDKQEILKIKELPVHADAVSGLKYDSKSDTLISCSHDKTFAIVGLKDTALLATVDYQASWLASLALEPSSSLVFFATYGRNVEVYDVEGAAPKRLKALTGHKGSVRCLHFDSSQRYLFSGGFDHSVGVWHIPQKDEAHRARSVGWLTGGVPAKIKAITFSPADSVVFAGHESGKIAVWDVTQGKLLYSMDAHRGDIMNLEWFQDTRTLVSTSLDGVIKFWSVPRMANKQ